MSFKKKYQPVPILYCLYPIFFIIFCRSIFLHYKFIMLCSVNPTQPLKHASISRLHFLAVCKIICNALIICDIFFLAFFLAKCNINLTYLIKADNLIHFPILCPRFTFLVSILLKLDMYSNRNEILKYNFAIRTIVICSLTPPHCPHFNFY